MADDSGSSIQQQVEEYKNQLRDVEELIQLTPDDESLLSLKVDLIELIRITCGQNEEVIQEQQPFLETQPLEYPDHGDVDVDDVSTRKRSNEAISTTTTTSFADIVSEAAILAAADETNRTMCIPMNDALHSDQIVDHDNHMKGEKQKKAKKSSTTTTTTLKEFEIPNHLIPVEGDSEVERNKKRRAIKALKSKYREKKKDMESTMKQQSWQNFQKKNNHTNNKNKSSTGTIFSTATSSTTNMGKVGVVTVSGGRHITDFGERKRHK